MKYTNKIILILTLFIFACNNNTSKVEILSNEQEESFVKMTNNFDNQNSRYNYQFFIAPLDSLFMEIKGCEIIEIQVTKMDSIEKYTELLGMFSEKNGLESIFYKTTKTCNDSERKLRALGYVYGTGFMTQLNFNNVNNAQNSFLTFSEELLQRYHSNEYMCNLKAGAICFLEKKSIYIIGASTCGSTKDFDRIEKVIREQVFNNKEFKGIKVYCGLKNPQILKF